MTDAVDPTHVNPPQQARSKRTLERIVRAALEILEREGPDGLTVQAVVSRARSSVGSFYARFKGKEELLEYLEARIWEETRARWQTSFDREAWSGGSGADVADAALRLITAAHASRATYLKALDRMGAGGGDGYGSFRRFVLETLSDAVLRHGPGVHHPDPQAAVRLVLTALYGALEAGDPASGEPFDEAFVAREGRRLLLRYLGGGGAAAAHADDAAAPLVAPEPPAAAASARGDVVETPAPDGPPEAASAPEAGPTAERELAALSESEPEPAAESEPEAASEAEREPEAGPEGEAATESEAGATTGDPELEDDEGTVDFFDVWG